jgi:DNA processing protein
MQVYKNWNLEDLLTLHFLKLCHYKEFIKIIENYGSLSELISDYSNNTSTILRQNVLFGANIENSRNESEKHIDYALKKNYKIITYWDEQYPVLLKEIFYPPTILYVWGDLQDHSSTSISMVGTRICTNYGRMVAERFSQFFSSNGLIVTSGLAQGIDYICHTSSINSGGITYAVIACSLDKITTSYQKKLCEKIVETGGAIISEYKFGTVPHPGYFLQRNRIISGISKATIIVEAAIKSGALITANFAFDQQREVYAIPGNINSEKSRGTNKLIKDCKATLAYSPEQVFEELGFGVPSSTNIKQNILKTFNTSEEELVFNTIDSEPKHIDQISFECSIDISELLVILLNLEFDGSIRQLPGKYYIKAF